MLEDTGARDRVSQQLGIAGDWAWMDQVHGARVLVIDSPGAAGTGDALVTIKAGLPLAVRTADCVPVVLHGAGAVAVAHAGWRGLVNRVVEAARLALAGLGSPPVRAAVGPAIGPCCYEVGPDVLDRFPEFAAETTWGSPSVDLVQAAKAQLSGLDIWSADLCTHCEDHFHSHRQTGTLDRQVTLGWL